jgi:hypothetical protein
MNAAPDPRSWMGSPHAERVRIFADLLCRSQLLS